MDDSPKDFLLEATEHVDAASMAPLRFEKGEANQALVASQFRHIHTVKGGGGFLSSPRVGRLAHAAGTPVGPLRDGARATPALIDAPLSELMSGCHRHHGGFLSIQDVGAAVQRLTKLCDASLREGVAMNSTRGANS